MVPSQSSSSPLHSSTVGPLAPRHDFTPSLQVVVPALHSPLVVPHAAEVKSSSVEPSQSLSSPSQSSEERGGQTGHLYSHPLSSFLSRLA